MSKRHHRRKKTLVNQRFQLGISLKIVLCLAVYLLLFCMMALLSPLVVLSFGSSSTAALDHAARDLSLFSRDLLIPLGLTFACLALHCILLLHKVAGPAYRLRRTLEGVRDGDLSRDVHLRRGDYLTDVADSYNSMILALRADVAFLKKVAGDVAEELRGVAKSSPDSLRKQLLSVAEGAAEMNEILDRYDVEQIASSEDAAEPATPSAVTS